MGRFLRHNQSGSQILSEKWYYVHPKTPSPGTVLSEDATKNRANRGSDRENADDNAHVERADRQSTILASYRHAHKNLSM
jgi:hypothetical protein